MSEGNSTFEWKNKTWEHYFIMLEHAIVSQSSKQVE